MKKSRWNVYRINKVAIHLFRKWLKEFANARVDVFLHELLLEGLRKILSYLIPSILAIRCHLHFSGALGLGRVPDLPASGNRGNPFQKLDDNLAISVAKPFRRLDALV